MKDKEKQIEEMANMLEDFITYRLVCGYNGLAKMIYDKLLPEDSIVLSREEYFDKINQIKELKTLCNKTYEDLTKEIDRLEKVVKHYHELIENGKLVASQEVDQASKETAEKILKEFNNFLPNRASSNIEIKRDSLEDVRKALTVLAQAYHDKTQELAKQFGVEIKE